jgi:hypothetical protein
MQAREAGFALVGFESALLFESPEEIYARVFRELAPAEKTPSVRIEYCAFANPACRVKLEESGLHLRISDLFQGAPAPVVEALAHVLLSKLFRRKAPGNFVRRYKMYLNRKDIRRRTHLTRQIRGRKYISGPEGKHHNLEHIFDRLNAAHFDGLLGRPLLGWSRGLSRRLHGHFDPSHNAIVISRIFDAAAAPLLALEYLMFHEMLHLRYPAEHSGARCRVHTREFREAEKSFPRYKEARELLRNM